MHVVARDRAHVLEQMLHDVGGVAMLGGQRERALTQPLVTIEQLRLGALRSPEAARDEWARLKRENSDLLGKLTAVAVRADLGEQGIYYRIQAGSFGDAAAAEKLCGELKRRKLGCILAR